MEVNTLDENNYLEHYGVLGMKWGVRKSDREQRKATGDARKLAKLESKRYVKAGKALMTNYTMAVTNTEGNRRMQKLLEKQKKQSEKAQKKSDAFVKKIVNKYKDTKFSDIHVSAPYIRNGRTYCDVGFGLVYIDEGGTPIFNAYASGSTKNPYRKPGTR